MREPPIFPVSHRLDALNLTRQLHPGATPGAAASTDRRQVRLSHGTDGRHEAHFRGGALLRRHLFLLSCIVAKAVIKASAAHAALEADCIQPNLGELCR